VAFSSYLLQLVGPVRALAALVTTGQEARASVIRVFESSTPTWPHRPARRGAARICPGRHRPRRHQLRLRARASRSARLSLHVNVGETVALVGTSGSGKSTIAQLLPASTT